MDEENIPLRLSLLRRARLTILGLIHWLLFGRSSSPKSSHPERILIMRISAVGDFVLAIPSILKLRGLYPNAQILLVTAASTQRSIRDSTIKYNLSINPCPWVDFVYPSQVDHLVWIGSFALASLRAKVAPRISSFDPDLAIILPQQDGGTARSLALKLVFLRIIGVKCRVTGWHSGNGPLFRRWLFRHRRFEHAVMAPLRAILEAAPTAKFCEEDVKFALDIPAADQEWSHDAFARLGWSKRLVIAISPGSVQPHKQWPPEKYRALALELKRQTDACFVVVGTNDTTNLGELIVEEVGVRAANFCGKTTVSKLAALLRRCSLLVGNDGGSMHIAAAVGCRCVAVMPGIEYPGSVEPWGNQRWSVRHPVDCAPCYCFTHCPKGHNNCLVELPVSEVVSKCLAALAPNSVYA